MKCSRQYCNRKTDETHKMCASCRKKARESALKGQAPKKIFPRKHWTERVQIHGYEATLEIPTTRGTFEVVMDRDICERLMSEGWAVSMNRSNVKLPCDKSYVQISRCIDKHQETKYLSRYVLDIIQAEGMQAHHRDGNPLDNRRSNLMAVSPQEHMIAEKVRRRNS